MDAQEAELGSSTVGETLLEQTQVEEVLREPNITLGLELGSPTAVKTPSEQIQVEKVFESDEDQLLIECMDKDREVEGIFNKIGHSTPVFVASEMWTQIIN